MRGDKPVKTGRESAVTKNDHDKSNEGQEPLFVGHMKMPRIRSSFRAAFKPVDGNEHINIMRTPRGRPARARRAEARINLTVGGTR